MPKEKDKAAPYQVGTTISGEWIVAGRTDYEKYRDYILIHKKTAETGYWRQHIVIRKTILARLIYFFKNLGTKQEKK